MIGTFHIARWQLENIVSNERWSWPFCNSVDIFDTDVAFISHSTSNGDTQRSEMRAIASLLKKLNCEEKQLDSIESGKGQGLWHIARTTRWQARTHRRTFNLNSLSMSGRPSVSAKMISVCACADRPISGCGECDPTSYSHRETRFESLCTSVSIRMRRCFSRFTINC